MQPPFWTGPGTQTLAGFADRGRTAEAAGYDGLWSAESAHHPFLPLVAAAHGTTRLELGTAITVAFARNPCRWLALRTTFRRSPRAVHARARQPGPTAHSAAVRHALEQARCTRTRRQAQPRGPAGRHQQQGGRAVAPLAFPTADSTAAIMTTSVMVPPASQASNYLTLSAPLADIRCHLEGRQLYISVII
jgi:hypothetical protein